MNYYETNAEQLSKRYEQANVSEVQALLLKSFIKKSSILEIGCGSGRDASFMLSHDFEVYAIDGSEKMINEAIKYHPELSNKLEVQILPDGLDFEDGFFDGVYSIATLMHLDQREIEKTIKKISYTLKPNGIFLFSVSIQRDDIGDNKKDIHNRNFTTLPQEDWLEICRDNGFQPIETLTTRDGLDRMGIVWLTCVMEKIVEY